MLMVDVAFLPWEIVIAEGLTVKRKLPAVVLCASLKAKGSTVPLTVIEPSEKVRSKSKALSGTRLLDRLVVHSSELNP
jgi:hypothetical protein